MLGWAKAQYESSQDVSCIMAASSSPPGTTFPSLAFSAVSVPSCVIRRDIMIMPSMSLLRLARSLEIRPQKQERHERIASFVYTGNGEEL